MFSPGYEIPDGETLYRYAKKDAFPPGQTELPVSIFNDPNLSCDWERLRNSFLNSFHIGEGKDHVVAISVCDEIRNPKNPKREGSVVADWKQEIIYDPISEEDDPIHGANEAHCLIRGKKKAAVIDAIRRNSKLIYPHNFNNK